MAIDVVKYDGNPDVFAWKFPNNALSTWTQLIVNESQEAILMKDGKVCDTFPAGRYTLDTENIPILRHIINIPFGGQSPFAAEVWFVNRVFSLDVKWGTPSPIQLQDPKYKIFVPVRAFGQFGIKIENSRQFLFKLVGTLSVFDKNTLIRFFRGIYLTKAKDVISSYLVHKGISILEINAYLDEISGYLSERIAPLFYEYGIKLVSFYVNDISVPEDDSAIISLKKALSKKAEMDIIGYNYQQERSFDTLEGAAKNTSSAKSEFVGAGLGLGIGAGMGSMVGGQFGTVTKNFNISEMKKCPDCGAEAAADVKFCSKCGFDFSSADNEDDSSSSISCPSCGKALSKASKFCPECGYSFVKKCPGCGASLNGNVKFCPECGHALIKKCSNCGKELNANSKFCPECGTKVQ